MSDHPIEATVVLWTEGAPWVGKQRSAVCLSKAAVTAAT